jgi:hypothetical protein
MMEGRILQDNDNGDTDYEPIKYYKYSCEYKLVVIEYFQIIWTVLNNGSH